MRILSPLVLLVAAACAAAPGAANGVSEGVYQLTEINARQLPAPSPTEPNVTIEGGSLAVEGGARYRLELRARVGTQAASTAVVSGAYRAAGDSIFFSPDASTAPSAPVLFRASVDGARLRLRGEDGHEYTFSRR